MKKEREAEDIKEAMQLMALLRKGIPMLYCSSEGSKRHDGRRKRNVNTSGEYQDGLSSANSSIGLDYFVELSGRDPSSIRNL